MGLANVTSLPVLALLTALATAGAAVPLPELPPEPAPQSPPGLQLLGAQAEAAPPLLDGARSAPWMIEIKAKNVPRGSAVLWDLYAKDVRTGLYYAEGGAQTRIVKTEQAFIFAGPAGGYKVKCRLVKGDDTVELNWEGTITGGAAPTPVPPVPVPPNPNPPGPVHVVPTWVIVVEETSARTPAITAVLNDLDMWKRLGAKGVKYRVYDKDSPDAKARGYAQQATGVQLPAVLHLDATGKVTVKYPLPASAAELESLVLTGAAK